MLKLGYEITNKNNEIIVNRTTNETSITVVINQIKKLERSVDTSLPFLDHMVETFAWRANLNIGVKINTNIQLKHALAEDIGITIGRAILELFKINVNNGIEGYGFARGIIDEAYADVALSIEGRTNYEIKGPEFYNVEEITGYDLIAFLEGFCQGCRCSLKIEYSGKDPHHTWEAVFRALGLCIKKTLTVNEWYKNSISGLKGTLQ